jgi:hypothetical protein
MEPQNPVENRTTILERGRSVWEDFGPFIVGILVLLVVLGGVWYLWNKRTQGTDTATVISENQMSGGTVPLSSLSLSTTPSPVASVAPTASPVASPKPTPSGAPQVVNVTKGGVESTQSATTKGGLPKTGFAEDLLAVFSLSLLGAGFYLRKLANKII